MHFHLFFLSANNNPTCVSLVKFLRDSIPWPNSTHLGPCPILEVVGGCQSRFSKQSTLCFLSQPLVQRHDRLLGSVSWCCIKNRFCSIGQRYLEVLGGRVWCSTALFPDPLFQCKNQLMPTTISHNSALGLGLF